ncbi:MAG: PAS domain S-box protein, partial [Verrucomicrobia bacterium]|nr:PAS domain S-box protein [Verrucomicrobiota bacterium]
HVARIAIERKQSESALRDSEEKFHALFENASDAIIITEDDLFIDCNARSLEMFGCHSRDQFLGHPPYEFSPPFQPDGRDSTELALEKLNAALNGQPQFFEWTHTKLDGTPFPAEVSLVKVEVGDKTLIQGIVRDISERKRAEETIRQQNAELETRVDQRTAELSKANKELRSLMTTRRQLEKEILEISEREQKRIGQDLHDDLGQQLAGIWCLSQLLESSLVTQNSSDAAAAAKITKQLQESLELTRKLAQGLYPVALQAEGLSSALEELARRTTEMFKVNCVCKCPQQLVLDYTVATHLYRIAQEAITNAIKHGRAKNIEIELSSNTRQTYLTINNDGISMAKKPINGDGMGLRIMKYRADMIGGNLSIKSNNDNEGTSVTCMIHTPKK